VSFRSTVRSLPRMIVRMAPRFAHVLLLPYPSFFYPYYFSKAWWLLRFFLRASLLSDAPHRPCLLFCERFLSMVSYRVISLSPLRLSFPRWALLPLRERLLSCAARRSFILEDRYPRSAHFSPSRSRRYLHFRVRDLFSRCLFRGSSGGQMNYDKSCEWISPEAHQAASGLGR